MTISSLSKKCEETATEDENCSSVHNNDSLANDSENRRLIAKNQSRSDPEENSRLISSQPGTNPPGTDMKSDDAPTVGSKQHQEQTRLMIILIVQRPLPLMLFHVKCHNYFR